MPVGVPAGESGRGLGVSPEDAFVPVRRPDPSVAVAHEISVRVLYGSADVSPCVRLVLDMARERV